MSEEKQEEKKPWTPGYGLPYFVEPKFYESPTVREANLDRKGRVDVPNSYIHTKNKFLTDDDIMSIWQAPLVGYELTEEEKTTLATNPGLHFYRLTVMSGPCKAHLLNMQLDKCGNDDVGKVRETMLQLDACVDHYMNWVGCFNKHKKWYQLRQNEMAKLHPDVIKTMDRTGSYTRRTEDYPKYNIPKEL